MASAKKFVFEIAAEYQGDKELQKLQNDLKAIGQVDAFNKLTEQWQQTNTAFVEAKNKVRELRTELRNGGGADAEKQYASAVKQVASLSTALDKQRTKLAESRTAFQAQGVAVSGLKTHYNKLKAAAEEQGRILAAQNTLGVRSFKEVEAEIKGLQSAYATLKSSGTLSVKALAKAQDQLKAKTAALKQETNGWTSHLGRIQQGWIGLAGVIGAGYGFTAMVSNVSRSQKELENFARTAGMSAGQFDDYAFAVKSVGIEQDKLADISKDVKDKLGDFIETGGGEFKDFFENVGSKVGLTAEELIKLSGPDALVAVKKAMDDANVSAENQVFYLEALANDASLLLPLLADEGRLLKEKAAAGKELTDAVSDMDREAVAGVTESIEEMKIAFSTLATDVVAKLAPAITAITGTLTSLALAVAELPAPVVQVGVVVGGMISAFTTWHLGLKYIFSALKMGGIDLAATWATRIAPSLASSFTLSLGPLGLLTAALAAGFAVGTWLNQFDIVEKAGIALSAGLTKGFLKIKQAWAWISGGDTDAVQREIEEADRIYSEMFANVGKDSKTAAAAVKKSQGEMAKGAEASAAKQQQANKKAVEEMKAAYKKYVDEIKRLQDEIAGREQSLAEELRAMGRTGMSEVGAWKDRKKEAQEYEAAAKKAAAAGNLDKAVDLADKAKRAYADLNKEVKSGDKVLVSQQKGLQEAMDGVKRSGELAVTYLKKQEQAAVKAANALNEQSGGKLSEEFGAVQTEVEQVDKSIAGMEQTTIKMGKRWVNVWQDNRTTGIKALDELQSKIDQMDGQSINVIANVTQAKAAGGVIQALATGGVAGWRDISAGARLPGWGGGDKVRLLGEAGEVMINKKASRAAGYKAALAFNAQRWDIVMAELTKRFGSLIPGLQQGGPLLPNFTLPKLPSIQALQAGGPVLATAGAQTGDVGGGMNITLNYSGSGSRADARSMADMVLREIQRRQRGASS